MYVSFYQEKCESKTRHLQSRHGHGLKGFGRYLQHTEELHSDDSACAQNSGRLSASHIV